MQSLIKRFGLGVAGVVAAGTMAVAGMSIFSPSADASASMSPSATVSVADQSCTSGAHGVVAVNAFNCNNVQIGNDLVDVVGVGSNTSSGDKAHGQQNSSNQSGSSVTYKDESCNSDARGFVAVNALNCNNVEIGNDLADVVGIGGNN